MKKGKIYIGNKFIATTNSIEVNEPIEEIVKYKIIKKKNKLARIYINEKEINKKEEIEISFSAKEWR